MVGSSDGTGAAARFNTPLGVATDTAGNVYVADSGNYTIRKITPPGIVTTLAGVPGAPGSIDGTGPTAHFEGPTGVVADSAGNLYVADTNGTVRKVSPAGVVSTFATTFGGGGLSQIAIDTADNLYVTDIDYNVIWKIASAGVATTIVGQPGQFGFLPGPLPGVLSAPRGVALFGTTLYTTTNNAIVHVSNVP